MNQLTQIQSQQTFFFETTFEADLELDLGSSHSGVPPRKVATMAYPNIGERFTFIIEPESDADLNPEGLSERNRGI